MRIFHRDLAYLPKRRPAAAGALLMLLATAAAATQPACSNETASEDVGSQRSALVDDANSVLGGIQTAYEVYQDIGQILGATDDLQRVLAALDTLSSKIDQLQGGLDQADADIRATIAFALQHDWDTRVLAVNNYRQQAVAQIALLHNWVSGGKTDTNLISSIESASVTAAYGIGGNAEFWQRPSSTAGQPDVFEYRMALPQYLYVLAVRFAVIAAQHPQLAKENDAVAASVRSELATYASTLAAKIAQMEAGIDGASTHDASYDAADSQLSICDIAVEPLSNVKVAYCPAWTAGTQADLPVIAKRWMLSDKDTLYNQIGLADAIRMRDSVEASAQLNFFGPAGQFSGYAHDFSSIVFNGAHGNLVGDVDGDGLADIVGLGNGYIGVLRSEDSNRNAYETWWGGTFYGSSGTFLADVNGDHLADLVGVGDGYVGVLLSTGHGFGQYQTWSGSPFAAGAHGNLVGDVDGDGKADLVSLGQGWVFLFRSTGTGFANPVNAWNGTFYGTHGTFLADVDGDHRADLVGLGDGYVGVTRSTGLHFGGYETWWGGSFYGISGRSYMGDVDGDGRADLVALGSDQIGVIRSNGTAFGAYENWWTGNYGSTYGNYLADVDGDGRADVIRNNGFVPTSDIFGAIDYLPSMHAY